MNTQHDSTQHADDPDSGRFWDAAARGRLLYSRCTTCGTAWFPLRMLCSKCEGECEDLESAGCGEVYTFSRVHRSSDTGFGTKVPYVVGIIALDEGFRMVANLEPVGTVEIGQRCRVSFRPSPATGVPAPLFTIDPS